MTSVGNEETCETSDAVAKELISELIVWDNHSCMPLRPDDDFLPQLQRCRDAGQTAVTLNVGFDLTDLESNIRVLAHFRRWVRRNSDRFCLIETASDVLEAKASGKLGVLFDLEGTRALGDQLSMVELYYDLGVRWMLMAYNRNNPWPAAVWTTMPA